MPKTRKLTPEDLATYKRRRERHALRRGSQWIFFKDNDPLDMDSWNGCTIRIIAGRRDASGTLHLKAELAKGNGIIAFHRHMQLRLPRPMPLVRNVQYSELW